MRWAQSSISLEPFCRIDVSVHFNRITGRHYQPLAANDVVGNVGFWFRPDSRPLFHEKYTWMAEAEFMTRKAVARLRATGEELGRMSPRKSARVQRHGRS